MGVFRPGRNSFFRLVPKPPPPEIFCAIQAVSCALGRQLTFFFCREVLVPVYCMSGSVVMLVRIPKNCSCVSSVSGRMMLCTRCVSQKNFFLYPRRIPRTVVPATVRKAPKVGGAENFPRPRYVCCIGCTHTFRIECTGTFARRFSGKILWDFD